MRLSRVQQEARRRIADLSVGMHSPLAFGSRLLSALSLAIPNDGAAFGGLDPGTLLVNRLLAVSDGDVIHFDEFLRRAYLVAEPANLTAPALMRATLPVVVLSDRIDRSHGVPRSFFANTSEQEHYRACREGDMPEGGVLRGCFSHEGRWVGWIEIVRDDPRRRFQPGDVAFLRLLAPLIGRAMAAAFDRERAASSIEAHDSGVSGVIMVDASGRVERCTAAAERWIELLGDAWHPTGPRGAKLPAVVWAALAQYRAGGGAGTTGELLVSTTAGPLRVEATPVVGGDAVAVVLTPARPELPGVPDFWPLTRREREVVGLVLGGLSNGEIAARLAVTEHTVQTHLARAGEKLGTRGRGGLLARFFRDAYWPAPRSSDAMRWPAPRTWEDPAS